MARFQGSPAHAKSMASYELHAWHDACSIAWDLSQSERTLRQIRALWDAQDPTWFAKFDRQYSKEIGEFLAKTESQRPAFLRRLAKSDQWKPVVADLFQVFAILAVVRARKILELRDRFRMQLAPGSGNRVTASAMYLFSMEMQDTFSYGWPREVFASIDVDDSDEG